jgi:hypothetical protein
MPRLLRKVVFRKPLPAFQSLPAIPAELCLRTPLANRLVEWRRLSQSVALPKLAAEPIRKNLTLATL